MAYNSVIHLCGDHKQPHLPWDFTRIYWTSVSPPSAMSYLETCSSDTNCLREKKLRKTLPCNLSCSAPFKSLAPMLFIRQSALQILALSYTCRTKDISFFQCSRWEGWEDHLLCFSLEVVCGCSIYSRRWMLRNPQSGSFPEPRLSALNLQVIPGPAERNIRAVPRTEQWLWGCGRTQIIFFQAPLLK